VLVVQLSEAEAVAIMRAAAAAAGVPTEKVDDDTAPLPRHTDVISTDVMVEGVDFAADLYPLRHAGVRAMVQNLSDLRSAGAKGCGFLWSLCLPPHIDAAALLSLSEGAMAVAAAEGMRMIGGDLSQTSGPLVISITVCGTLVGRSHRIQRRGARVGDVVCISAPLGASAAGLRHLLASRRPAHGDEDAFARWHAQLAPTAHIAVGAHLHSSLPSPKVLRHAHAAIDISDGFARDAHRLARASGVGLRLSGDIVDGVAGATREDALFGGEDHQLLFTQSVDHPLHGAAVVIGEVVTAEHGVWWCGEPLPDRGYDHGGPS
jgi:thiamine-monophosphate kinase